MKVWYLKEASKPFAISFSDHLDKNLSMGAKILEPTFKLTPFFYLSLKDSLDYTYYAY